MNPHNSNILIKSSNQKNKIQQNTDKIKSISNSKSLTKRKQNTELTERVYEQMLSNYYQTKYSKLMSKLTKQQFNVNYHTLLTNNHKNENTTQFQFQSERKNHINNSSNFTQNKKRKNFKELIRQKQMRSELSLQKGKNNKNQKSIDKNNKKFSIYSPHRCQEQRKSPKNQKSQRSSSSQRKNFRQSIRQKSLQNAEQRQNLQVYKKLQSSIIKELYSPSPKKIQSGKYSVIQLRNFKNIQKASNYNEDSLFPQNSNRSIRSNRSNKNSVKSSQFPFQNNIQIVQYKYEEDEQNQQNDEDLEQGENEFISKINPFNRQTIKNLAKRRQLMERYSPMKGSSRKSQKSNQSQQKIIMQQRVPWNPNFMNQNTFNKSLSNISSDGSKSSPRKKQELKNYNNNVKLTSSELIINQQNLHKNQNINQIEEVENQYSHQYFYQKPQKQYENQKKQENDFDIPQDDGDIEFILPINEGLNLSNRRNNNDYNFEDDLTQREKLILEFQQNNKQINNSVDNNSVNHKQKIPTLTQSNNKSQKNFSSKNPSLNNSMNQISMISRFSMTQDEGALIKQKLDHQIINNQFGPYQNALADLRDLINQFPTAWPIYVVGQRTLDDRDQYQSKRELQKKIMTDYLQRIERFKQKNSKNKNESDQQYKIRQNKLKIMRLVRTLSKKTIFMN